MADAGGHGRADGETVSSDGRSGDEDQVPAPGSPGGREASSEGGAAVPASGSAARLRPLLLLLIALPLIFGLYQLSREGGLRVTPDFDWSPYPVAVQEAVDRAAKNADCGGLAKERAWAVSDAAAGIDTAPLVEHIDAIRQLLVCPPVR